MSDMSEETIPGGSAGPQLTRALVSWPARIVTAASLLFGLYEIVFVFNFNYTLYSLFESMGIEVAFLRHTFQTKQGMAFVLAMVLIIAFLLHPARRGRAHDPRVNPLDWGLAALGAICAFYIFFEYNRAVIEVVSYELLDEIAALILDHPELRMVRVEGHTDSDGDDVYNLKLSQARAEAVVEYLVGKGIERDRLDPAGFGETRPVAGNDTDLGRARNRRVEFLIVERE